MQDAALAFAAAAIAAFEGHRDAFAQRGVEHRFALAHDDEAVVRMNQDMEAQRGARGARAWAAATAAGNSSVAPPTSSHNLTRRPAVDQREHRQVEPVQCDLGHRFRKVGRRLADRRPDERERNQRRGEHQQDRPRRLGFRLRHALGVDPQQRQHGQRDADMDERQQREQAVADVFCEDEIAHQRAAEHRQPVEPLGGRDHGDELRETVPRQHVAVDARHIHQPQQHDPADPGEPAKAPVTIEDEMPRQVQQHGEHHAVRGIAVQTAQHAAQIPLLIRQALDRGVGLVYPGLEEGVEVEPAHDHDPEHPGADRAEVVKRIEPLAESEVEQRLDAHEQPLPRQLYAS